MRSQSAVTSSDHLQIKERDKPTVIPAQRIEEDLPAVPPLDINH